MPQVKARPAQPPAETEPTPCRPIPFDRGQRVRVRHSPLQPELGQIGALLESFLRSTSYLAERAWRIADWSELPLELKDSLSRDLAWGAWVSRGEKWFVAARAVDSVDQAGENALRLQFYSAAGRLIAFGTWQLSGDRGWVLRSE